MDRGDFAAAIDRLDEILAVDWSRQPDNGPAYDVKMAGEMPWSEKALCLFRLGAYEEAATAYRQAAAFAPDNASYRVKEQLALARAQRPTPGTVLRSDKEKALSGAFAAHSGS